jgi:hypothetical protein
MQLQVSRENRGDKMHILYDYYSANLMGNGKPLAERFMRYENVLSNKERSCDGKNVEVEGKAARKC